MIPLKLQLKNFLSYGPEIQTVDFSSYSLICLSGKNGHGKSALLDAITWALWGEARKTFGVSKADMGLLRLGQTQMLVVLDFEFNGQTYRVRREFAKTYGKPLAGLEFGILNQDTDTLIPLTEKTIRHTQEKIEKMLNLDMESFINSAFLRQGQANEFSKKTAQERKKILATILGLDRYEHIRKLAVEKAKVAMAHKNVLTAVQDTMKLELEQRETISKNIGELTHKLNGVELVEKELLTQKETQEKQQAQLAQDANNHQMLTYQLAELAKQEQEQLTTLRSTRTAWRTTHKKQLTLSNQQELEARKNNLVNEIIRHQQALQKNLELKELYLKTKEQLQLVEKHLRDAQATTLNAKKLSVAALQLEQQADAKKIQEITVAFAVLAQEKKELFAQIALIRAQSAPNQQTALALAAQERQFERRRDYYQRFIAQGNLIKSELASLGQKKGLVHDDENPSCPLCEQNLSASRKRFLKATFATHERFMTHRLGRLTALIGNLKDLLVEQHAQITALKKAQEEQKTSALKLEELIKADAKLTATIAEQEKQCAQINASTIELTKTIAAQQQECEALTKQQEELIKTNTDYSALHIQLGAIEQEGKALQYDAKHHQASTAQLKEIEQQLAVFADITQQVQLQAQRATTIAQTCTQLKQYKKQHAQLTVQLAAFADLATRTATLKQSALELIQRTATLTQEKETLLQEKGSLHNQQIKLNQVERSYKLQAAEITLLELNAQDYQTIATATSKDGIQALLIEEAIPEIEQEANRLLAKLTNNQAQIFIESLRDLQKGGTKETLDIKISDAIGIRPYEMFSGGEAFRIDFALRIAISKLLARRAGTSLQTLIIDEGFGSQDEEGLGNIMDALYKIQDDFCKVIIVSHLPAMKDQFPVHFFVQKGPNGSTVEIMEQG